MASLQNFYTSRDNNANADSYVGQLDRLWYNPGLNSIYVSDGSTPGGIPVGLATAANAIFTNITVNGNVLGNLHITGNISAAANGKIGGITPGPGVEVSDTGLLTIDSAGLPISFGDFYANVNQLSMVNANEAMYLVSNGTGNINLIGGVNFYKPNGFPPSARPFFAAKNDGQITILIPAEDPVEGGVEIIGSSTGNYIAPGQPGTMLQLTGNPGTPTRVYHDGNNEYSAYVARRWNGNVAAPTQVLAGEDVFRINATAATDAGVGNVAMAQIQFRALENQTTTAQGSTLNFIVTPVGSSAASRVEVANITVANGVSATKFTTTGNITGGNLNLAGNIVADYVVANNVGSTGNVEIESNNTYWYFTTDNRFVGNGNVVVGNVSTTGMISATGNSTGGNLTTAGQVTATGNITGGNLTTAGLSSAQTFKSNVRNAGAQDGGTLTLDFATDSIVRATYDNTTFTVAFSNYAPGKKVTLILTNVAGGARTFNVGVPANQNTKNDATPSIAAGRVVMIDYYSIDGDVGNVFASINYA